MRAHGQIAVASGFGCVRRFNASIRKVTIELPLKSGNWQGTR
jgi:hypothetical protein